MLAKIKNIVFAHAFCLLAMNGFAQDVSKTNENKIHNIVVQLNTADTASWSSVIGNIKNIQKAWPTNLNIEVVVHGKAIDFLVKDKTYFTSDIQLLASQGIKFNACQNTMRKHNITSEMLLNVAGTVPSGVVEVVTKQEEGWSYLKSGL
jgi:intracellular sulfur oxidation DsrE/DsrF family protein